jgi:hypothetical protein
VIYGGGRWGVAAGSPVAALLSVADVMPWWAALGVVLACLVVYICRMTLAYRLGAKALDKAGPAQVPAVMEAITGRSRSRRKDSAPSQLSQ